MVDRLRVSLYGMMFFAFLALTGCPPPATTKPEAPPAAPPPQPTARESAPAAPVAPASSSLEAARRDTTPAPSPLNDIYFDFDKYDLKTEARDTLKANAGWLKANPAARVEIEGHCDERGSPWGSLKSGYRPSATAKSCRSARSKTRDAGRRTVGHVL